MNTGISEKSAVGTGSKVKIRHRSLKMKNPRKNNLITREDIDSFFFRKAFVKLIKRDTPLIFILKVPIAGAFFIVLLIFMTALGDLTGE